jgi:hypothetical protein
MAYTDFSDFQSYVMNEVQGCPRPVMDTFIRKFAIRLCEKGQVLRKDASEINITAEERTYALNFTENLYKAISIHYAEYESGQEMSRTSEAKLKDSEPTWKQLTTSGRPQKGYLTLDNKLHVVPKPTADVDNDPITVTCVVKPVRTATKIDTYVFENYAETIAYGALSELQLMQQQSWYNEKLAEQNARKWRQGLRQARAHALNGYDGDESGSAYPQDYMVFGS